jgi:hypothetical protein
MIKKIALLVAGAAALTLTATATMAASNAGGPGTGPLSAGAPDIFAPYAQAEAFIGQSGAVVSAKGFAKVTHPSVGVVCLELAAGIDPTRRPVVSVEWGRSLGVALFAQYDASNVSCPSPTANTIEVRTYKADTGGVGSPLTTPVLSNAVAFVITVP